ncbi:keratin, type II cytoskeletal 2 epidermal-like [Brachypodium distachyon]|uniref:keratin, type II cytoskeletal 2 epidermal-like n=1 Tax=Brachypodium distachyon TaxID=15368 RepID=UPI000D0DF974|nr:keratin, type II cytoskeletal 2 epidermal-like [Brachypodium distachyon]|eukprot:XP_024310415.1 keratin, type II cytoskeletal 2 epidermal-like [Brachypodium distachyon]
MGRAPRPVSRSRTRIALPAPEFLVSHESTVRFVRARRNDPAVKVHVRAAQGIRDASAMFGLLRPYKEGLDWRVGNYRLLRAAEELRDPLARARHATDDLIARLSSHDFLAALRRLARGGGPQAHVGERRLHGRARGHGVLPIGGHRIGYGQGGLVVEHRRTAERSGDLGGLARGDALGRGFLSRGGALGGRGVEHPHTAEDSGFLGGLARGGAFGRGLSRGGALGGRGVGHPHTAEDSGFLGGFARGGAFGRGLSRGGALGGRGVEHAHTEEGSGFLGGLGRGGALGRGLSHGGALRGRMLGGGALRGLALGGDLDPVDLNMDLQFLRDAEASCRSTRCRCIKRDAVALAKHINRVCDNLQEFSGQMNRNSSLESTLRRRRWVVRNLQDLLSHIDRLCARRISFPH